MAQPLSPRSESSLNLATPNPPASSFKKSPLQSQLRQTSAQSDLTVNSVTSSPFQTEVGTDVAKENLSGVGLEGDPSRSRAQEAPRSSPAKGSPSKSFDIYEEGPDTLPQTLSSRLSPQKQRASIQASEGFPSKRSTSDISPGKTHGKGAMLQYNLKEDSLGPGRYDASREDEEIDQDTRSVLSDDTCFSNF